MSLYTLYYSNLAYALLGRLLVRYHNKGMLYETYIQQEILDSLEMTNTGFDYTTEYAKYEKKKKSMLNNHCCEHN